jgi:hypothetical protein
MKKIVVLIPFFGIIMFSCTEKANLNTENNENVSAREIGFISLNIPSTCKESTSYTGEVYSNLFNWQIILEGTNYTVECEVEWSENMKLIYIAISEEWFDEIGMDQNYFIDNLSNEMYTELNQGTPPNPDDDFWDKLKYWLIGVTTCDQCLNGIKQCCWEHPIFSRPCWSVGC